MIILKGKSVFDGIAIGPLVFYRKNKIKIQRRRVEDAEKEILRFEDAVQKAGKQLKGFYEKALEDVGSGNAMIFQIHQMILEDVKYRESVIHRIRTHKVNAEFAVAGAAKDVISVFDAMDDGYIQGRSADVKDVSERLIHILSNSRKEKMRLEEPAIIAADDLVPSETLQLDKEKTLSIITMFGTVHSHTAILARMMNIPVIMDLGEELKQEYDGRIAIVDGTEGVVYIDPDDATMAKMREKQTGERKKKAFLEGLKGKENVTKSGRRIQICANISDITDMEAVEANDAGGIGLFRSEFLYMERETFPTEEQQFLAYREAAERMKGKRVIIRTLDVGADKQIEYMGLKKEENPALGYRAIRICLRQPKLFKTQLRALYRASSYGRIAILLPMIISVEEVRRVKEMIREVKAELQREGLGFGDEVELGVMIETPAAVMLSRQLAKEVDFFSVGTNDLTQYILALDRQNQMLEEFYDAHHPAVMEMIRMAAESAHAEGKWIGICGELATDLSLTETFLDMGIDELSVPPSIILPLRHKVRESR